MKESILSVREIKKDDIDLVTQYWLDADNAFLTGMGVDTGKMPGKEEWKRILAEPLGQSYEEKKSYCIIWLEDNKPIGHSNVNKIIFGEEAYMHLHVWYTGARKKGSGTILVKKTLPFFFGNLQLKKICCEPYALNPAPNKTLAKAGFRFVKEYITTPGWLNYEQPVNHWEISYDDFMKMQ
ncbi:MAG: GNAT family protein [Bacteroidota bacterium]|nr:GNAT family protein [Bacteroidota bacterium]